jgi:hypothetical protein
VLFRLDSSPANSAAANLSATLNLSNAGGVYALDAVSMSAVQRNSGIPEYLHEVSVRAMAANGDRVYAAVDLLPVLRSEDGGETWTNPYLNQVPPFSTAPLGIAVSHLDPDQVLVAARSVGLWRSADGGASWSRDTELTPEGTNVNFMKTVVMRRTDLTVGPRIYLGIAAVGLYFSDDGGTTFRRASLPVRPEVFVSPLDPNAIEFVNCGSADPTGARVEVTSVAVSPNNPARLYVGVKNFGVYSTVSDHASWVNNNAGLIRCSGDASTPLFAGARRTVNNVTVLSRQAPGGQPTDVIVVATELPLLAGPRPTDLWFNSTLFVSVDGGANWQAQGEGFPKRANGRPDGVVALFPDPSRYDPSNPSTELGVLAATLSNKVYQLNLGDSGPARGVWVPWSANDQIYTPNMGSVLQKPGSSDVFLLGTVGSGVYELGDVIDLTRAVNLTAIQEFGQDLPQLGVSISFDQAGTVSEAENFKIRGQVFQGYAVWRARKTDEIGEPQWQLIGLYDLTNPETCSTDPCDAPAIAVEEACFAEKRANCFLNPALATRPPADGWWEFFDRDVYNGFAYWYAISTVDYLFTGDVQPGNLRQDLLFSPRSEFESDPGSTPFKSLQGGVNYNTVRFEVNVVARTDLNEVYVVPNPLVRSAGFDAEGESSVRIVNVTESARVQFYTVAGDLVRELDNVIFDSQETGNIKWDTRNAEGELVASGVYIYRVTDDSGNEHMSRLTIIR